MKNKFISVLLLLLLSVAFGCGEDKNNTSNDSPFAIHPCELADACLYNPITGETACDDGYVWEDEADQENYNCVPAPCTPTTCDALGATCGSHSDGCDGSLDCGSCAEDQLCQMTALGSQCEDMPIPELCGNGVLDPDEECDLVSFVNGDSYVFRDGGICPFDQMGTVTCNADCSANLNNCRANPTCGDGVLNQDYESCDGTDFGSLTCERFGFTGGNLTCNDGCELELQACEQPVPLMEWSGDDRPEGLLGLGIDPRDDTLVVWDGGQKIFRESESPDFSVPSAEYDDLSNYGSTANRHFQVLPDGRAVFASRNFARDTLVVSTETAVNGSLKHWRLENARIEGRTLAMTDTGHQYLLVDMITTEENGSSVRALRLFEHGPIATTWLPVDLGLGAGNQVDVGCNETSRDGFQIDYTMTIGPNGLPVIVRLSCSGRDGALIVENHEGNWRQSFPTFRWYATSASRPTLFVDNMGRARILLKTSGRAYLLQFNLPFEGSEIDSFSLDEAQPLFYVSGAHMMSDGSLVLAGTDSTTEFAGVFKYTAELAYVSGTLVRYRKGEYERFGRTGVHGPYQLTVSDSKAYVYTISDGVSRLHRVDLD